MILAIDIGTSSFKSALWDFEGNRRGFAASPLLISLSDGLRHEADPGQWLGAFEDCCGRLGDLSAVEAVVISGNGPSLTPVVGEPARAAGLCLPAAPCRLWLDRRAGEAAAEVSALVGDFVDGGFFLPKALGIKKNEPGLYEKTRFFLGCPEYLACALTGEARTVFPSAGFDRWFWNADILGRLDLDEAKFPPFISPGESFGTLLPAIAGRFGFARNVPVIAGGPDFYVAILGAGAVSPGRACDRSGTSEGINACTEERITDRRLMSYGHPVKPFWNLSGIISTTGKALEWARNLLGLADFGEFFSLAAASPPGAGGLVFLPYLAGERAPIWDSAARGVFRGLSLSTDRAGLARSVLEGVCFAIRDVIAVMEESGARVGELRVSGAAAENGLLNQIKADITGAEILIPAHREAELLGLAIIGARALGKYASLAEAAAALVRVESRREPNPGNTVLYDELFSEYRETYRRLKGQGE